MRLAPTCSFGLILGLVFTSCASTPAPPLPELSMLSVTPVDYDYNFGSPPPRIDWAMPQGDIDHDFEGRLVQIDAFMYEVDRTSSDVIDPERPLSSAFVTSRADAERFMNEAEGTERAALVNHQKLACYEQQSAYVSVIHQTAFISRFEVEQAEYSVVADPVVDVLTEGAVLRLLAPSVSQETVFLEAALVLCAAKKPFPVVEWTPVLGVSPVEIQRPVVALQELKFDAELGPDQFLVVKCENPNDKNTRLLFFLEAHKLEN